MKRNVLFCIYALFVSVSISYADDYYWNDAGGGELGDATKWNPPGTPGVDDYVYFTLPNSFTVWLEDSYTHDRLTVDQGAELTLNLNGYNYMLDTTNDWNKSVIIGDAGAGSLTVSGGMVQSRDLNVGWASNDSIGALNLSGADTAWIGNIDGNYFGFWYGNSTVSVTNDAYLEHGHGQCAIGGTTALFTVDGEYSTWFVAGYFGMSGAGNTTVNISNGGQARFGFLEMAVWPGSTAVINVTGESRESELTIENNLYDPIGLFIGREGRGVINLTGSKLYHNWHTAIGQYHWGQGELNIFDGSWADLQGSVGVGGSLHESGGEGLIYLYDDPFNGNNTELTCAQDSGRFMVVWPKGKIRMDGGNIRMEYWGIANPITLKGGTLEGWGSIWAEVNNESGLVSLGSVGDYWRAMELKYNYVQGPKGTLKIGMRSGTDGYFGYGALLVTEPTQGQVILDGMLDVELEGTFVPSYSDEYVIIQGQSVTGQFINAPSQLVFDDGRFEVIYTETTVTLTHFTAEPKCPEYPVADYNKDCLVNLADFAVLAGQWLTCVLEPSSSCP